VSRDNDRFFFKVFTLVVAGVLTAIAARYLHRVLDRAETHFGWRPNPEGVAEFLDELDTPYFAQAAPEAMAHAEKIDTFLFRQMDEAHRARYGTPYKTWRQSIGDCVAFGAGCAVYASESVSYSLGQLPQPPLLPATEALYGGSRVEARNRDGSGAAPVGGWSDGSYGGAAARWLRDWGVVYRQPFPEFGYDLTTYSGERSKNWGAYGNGGQGDGGRLDKIAQKHPARYVVQVRTWDELVAAITAGFPVTIASNQGFTTTTNERGVLEASGTWYHQMCCIGVAFAEANEGQEAGSQAGSVGLGIDAALIMNSWGENWLAYRGRYPADQPSGSFWARRSVIERMLAQGDSYAIGDIHTGFRWRDIHHGEWLHPVIEAR
jgi:hypothetical protein